MYTIYALVDPVEDYKVCYVGMSSDIMERYIQHLRCSDRNPAKNEWVKGLQEKGYVPTLRTLEVVETEGEAFRREAYWIHFYKGLHMPLTNTHIPPVSMKQKEYAFSNALRVPEKYELESNIRSFLEQSPRATIREIARKCGCSVSTANKWAQRIRQRQEPGSA